MKTVFAVFRALFGLARACAAFALSLVDWRELEQLRDAERVAVVDAQWTVVRLPSVPPAEARRFAMTFLRHRWLRKHLAANDRRDEAAELFRIALSTDQPNPPLDVERFDGRQN